MTEPMTDARVLLALRDECREHQSAGLDTMTMSVQAVLALFDQRDAERSRADAAEAARDAALARAMPEPVPVRTAAEVGALTTGAYRIAAPWRPREWLLGHRYPTRTWTLLIGMHASGVMDDDIVGSWVQRLPDLLIPTPTQEG